MCHCRLLWLLLISPSCWQRGCSSLVLCHCWMLVPAYSHLLGTRQLQHGICQQYDMNIMHPLKSMVELVSLGGTGWLLLLHSPVAVLIFWWDQTCLKKMYFKLEKNNNRFKKKNHQPNCNPHSNVLSIWMIML